MKVKRCVNYSITVILAAILISGQLSAKEGKSSLEQYTWALQFSIRNNFMLGSFQDGMLSLKQQISPKSAFRYGISIMYSGDNDFAEHHELSADFALIYQRYLNPVSPAKFYWGIGPYLHEYYDYHLRSSDEYYREQIDKNWGIGIRGIGGIEWFATDVISIHAEYQIDALWGWHTFRLEDKAIGEEPESYERRHESFDFSNNRVVFGISIYF